MAEVAAATSAMVATLVTMQEEMQVDSIVVNVSMIEAEEDEDMIEETIVIVAP